MPDDDLNLQTPPPVDDDDDPGETYQDPEPDKTGETEDPETSEKDKKPEGDDDEPKTVSLDEYQKVMGQLKWSERELKRLKSGEKPESSPQPPTDKPKVGNYETYDEFVEALTDWKVAQQKQHDIQKQQETNKLELQRKVDAKIAAEVTKNPDFLKTGYIPEALAEIMAESDYIIEMAKYFGKNPSEAFNICKMSPVQAAREIGKLESKLMVESKRPEPKTESRAPSSTKNVIGGQESAGKDPMKMSTEEYIAWANKKEFGGK